MIKLDPLTIWNIFFYFFGNYVRWECDGKVDLGNNDLANLLIQMFYLVKLLILAMRFGKATKIELVLILTG